MCYYHNYLEEDIGERQWRKTRPTFNSQVNSEEILGQDTWKISDTSFILSTREWGN